MMYKVIYEEYQPSPDTAPGFYQTKFAYLTAEELEKFSETHKEFEVETIKWEPSRED